MEFLLGGFDGIEMMYPPNDAPIRFEVHSDSDWEASDRYIRMEVFSRASISVFESMLVLIGFDTERSIYRMWTFARSQTEPMYLSGEFVDGSLVMISEPAPMIWGTQKVRHTLTPVGDDAFDYQGDLWTLDGWQRYFAVRMKRAE